MDELSEFENNTLAEKKENNESLLQGTVKLTEMAKANEDTLRNRMKSGSVRSISNEDRIGLRMYENSTMILTAVANMHKDVTQMHEDVQRQFSCMYGKMDMLTARVTAIEKAQTDKKESAKEQSTSKS
jgi:hypothetical protein